MEHSQKLTMAYELLRDAEDKVATARHLLESVGEMPVEEPRARREFVVRPGSSRQIIEGVFDGQSMIGSDRKIYPVPANYASKSKLVEGDTLKLTIVEDGSFIYKQIGPVDRKTVRGELVRDERGEYRVQVGTKQYRVLLASVTYFKGVQGDEITLLLPASGTASWAAIENIIKATSDQEIPDLVRESMERLSENESEVRSHYKPEDNRAIPVTNGEEPGPQ
ncbi:MAG: hypothetical protein V1895_03580 [Parcubacteria group bacterium]